MKETQDLIEKLTVLQRRSTGVREGRNTKDDLEAAKKEFRNQVRSLQDLPNEDVLLALEKVFVSSDGTRRFRLCMNYLAVGSNFSYLEKLVGTVQEGNHRRAFRDAFTDEVDAWRKILQTARR